MEISSTLYIVAIVFALLLASTLAWLFIKQRRQMKAAEIKLAGDRQPAADGLPSRQLQLQAYERLILLTDRIALPNLIQRVNQPGLSAREMQSLLTLSIRQEFEHNITQQLYVSAEAWDAVRNYKDQNLLMQNPKASLQNVVSEALSYEAKKLL
jgi:hypothetical protein